MNLRTESQKRRYYRRVRAGKLAIGGTAFFPLRDDGETVRQCQARVGALLRVWKETYPFRWSVRQDAGGVKVTKVGKWPEII